MRPKVTYKIVQKKNHNAVYASGFSTLKRAEDWLTNYNPNYWTDKTIQASDLEIIEDKIS